MNIVTADQFAILRLWARNFQPVRLQSGGLENENQNREWNCAIYIYKLELSLSDSTQFVLQYQLMEFWTLEITSQIWFMYENFLIPQWVVCIYGRVNIFCFPCYLQQFLIWMVPFCVYSNQQHVDELTS